MPVVVVGAGIAGASCALELHDRGMDVLLLDRGDVAKETTGVGEGNVLVADKLPGPELDLARAGRAVWDELAGRFPEAVRIRRKGALVLFEDGSAPAFAARLGADAEVVEDPRALEPALAPDLPPAVLVRGDAQVDPRGAARAMAAELGERVRTRARVLDLAPDGVRLASGERVAADAVVLAAGPWSAAIARRAGWHLPVVPRKGQLLALGPAPGLVRHKLFEAGYLELRDVAAVVEEALSGEVYVGSSRAFAGFDDDLDPAVTDALHARAARFVPALAGLARTRAWCGFRPFLEEGPAIGPSRRHPGLWACTGHEGAGVGLGPVSGRLVAQLLCGEAPVVDPAPWDPDRYAAERAS